MKYSFIDYYDYDRQPAGIQYSVSDILKQYNKWTATPMTGRSALYTYTGKLGGFWAST